MTPFTYLLYGERSLGLTMYVVSLYHGRLRIRSWFRFSKRAADRKGAYEVRKATARWHW